MRTTFTGLCVLAAGSILVQPSLGQAPEVWKFDRLDKIHGLPLTVVGHPKVIRTPLGKAIQFNGTDDESLWRARASEASGVCQLGWGSPDAAWTSVSGGWVHGNQNEISLLMAFIAYEQGKKDDAYALLLTAERKQDAKVQASLKAWLDGLGLGLR